MSQMEVLKEKLKETGFKITPQRRAIIETLLKHKDKHLSSEEIYDFIKLQRDIEDEDYFDEVKIKKDIALVRSEMKRFEEFNELSENKFDNKDLEYKIRDLYNLYELITE